MRRRLIIFFLSIINLTSLPAFDAGSLRFNRLSVENGLPHNVVHKICRDHKGYLWIATAYGLCRYDGYQIRTFLKEELDVGTNYISNILIDRRGNLWICSGEGVSVYGPHFQRFTNLNSITGTDIKGSVTEIVEDTDGTVLIGVNEQGIYAVNPQDWTFEHKFFRDGKQTLPANVSAMFTDSGKGVRIIGLYNNDLYVADSTLTTLKPFRTRDGKAPFLGKSIKHILPSSSGKYYVSYSAKDICRINPFTMEFEHLDIPIEGAVRLKVMQFIDRNILAIASNYGLYFYNVSTRELQNLRYDQNNRWGIPGNNIIYIGGNLKKGILMGTFNDGLAIQHTPDVGFQRFDKCRNESLAGCRVSGFAQDKRGTIYISTEQSGLLTFSEKDRTIRHFPHRSRLHSLSGIYIDGDYLWVMSSVGIERFDLKTGKKKEYLRNRVDNYTLYKDLNGRLLLGTTLGLEVYDSRTDCFRPLPELKGRYICNMLEDNRGRMWFATYADGIFIRDGDSFRQLTSENSALPTNKTLALFLDSRGSIWVRTSGEGVVRIDDDEDIAIYNRENALTSDVVYAMTEDSKGCIWVTSDKGMTIISNVGENIHFTMSDGLLNPGFTARAAFTTTSGNLLMGSRDGFIMYNSENYVKDTTVPGLEISEFRLSNSIVLPGDSTGILEQSISETTEIVLAPDQNSFGFSFSLIDCNSSKSGDVFYMLEGYDDSWHSAGSDRLVNFVKVPPGEYRLMVKGVNGKGVWNTFCPPLQITVRPHFRQTAAAQAILSAIIFLMILGGLAIYRMRLERKRKEQEIKMKIDLNNEKVNFFMTIAHEIKTPLTLIRTPLDSILGKKGLDSETVDELGIIDRNTSYLTQLIGELLDFTRLEQKGYKLSCSSLNLCDEVEFILFNYRNAFEKNGIRLEYEIPPYPVLVWADKPGLAKILNNLLSNALRHSKTYTSVKVFIEDGNAVLSCRNDGQVVPTQQREKIFDSFVQYRDTDGKFTEGFGIGLSVSRTLASLHSGTLAMDDDLSCNNFILRLPLYESTESISASIKDSCTEERDSAKDTIMIVEDNEELREYVRKKLSLKYNVLSARDGQEAMAIIEKTCCIDLVVTDISMPVMDGLELCRRIKEDFTYSHILVIILSANLTGRLKITSMDKGADMIVEKPFSMDYLTSCIEGLIHNRKMIMERIKNTPEAGNPETETPPMSSRDELLIRMIDKCISDNLSDPEFSLERLSEMLKMSKSTLNRKMKDLLGTSPNDYIRDRRLIKAEEMLSNSVERVNEICWAVGFQTPSYFIKCFRKKYGMSPTEYVRSRH